MKDTTLFTGSPNFDRKAFNVYLVIYIGFMIKKPRTFGDAVIDCRSRCWSINSALNVSIASPGAVLEYIDLLLILINSWPVNVICRNDT